MSSGGPSAQVPEFNSDSRNTSIHHGQGQECQPSGRVPQVSLRLVFYTPLILFTGKAQRKKEIKKACFLLLAGDLYTDPTPNSRTRQRDRRIATLPWSRKTRLVRPMISRFIWH